ncbi:MAG: tRNA (adenosine(37)-N6)-threonylcarbamoyltransferase complex transferase subunit TsaD [Alphaproteobacteria bacterium]|nr:tRNA (adenosine(37)-N6)-threonylcarbamoyltransferase complex transferase subunit TsaD [Alphaproteobacteria bacterium]
MGSATHTSDATGLGQIVLGIESSCDETAVALVRADRTIIAQAIASQEAEHAPYGGVVPEIAARAHAERVAPMVAGVMAQAGLTLDDVDAVAATAGPGLIGGVMIGLVSAKALAMASGKPLLAINHLEGHALSPRLADSALAFPYLLLLVSGGHCQILAVDGVGQYRRLATTIDDALGEAFDKTAKLLRLGYPGGPAVERLALTGDPGAVPLPRPLKGSTEPHFSFAGLKSAVLRAKENQQKSVRAEPVEALPFLEESAGPEEKNGPSTSSGRAEVVGSARTDFAYSDADIAASFQQAAVDCLIDRLDYALRRAGPFPALVVAGGVAANQTVRRALEAFAGQHAMRFTAPPLALCTDNAAMIAWAGCERLAAAGSTLIGDPLDFVARPRWPLDPDAELVRGAGAKA